MLYMHVEVMFVVINITYCYILIYKMYKLG